MTRDGSWHSYLQELGVDLELGGGAALLLGGLPALLDALEEVVDGSRDDAQLLVQDVDVKARPHGVGLPRARLQEQEEEEEELKPQRRSSASKLANHGGRNVKLRRPLRLREIFWQKSPQTRCVCFDL